MIGLGVAVFVHILLGYAFITGLALKAIKHVIEPIKSVNIKEVVKPPEDVPPPPVKQVEIPPFVPPPVIDVQSEAAPTITVQREVPNPPPPPPQAPVAVAPPAPPAPTGPTQPASFNPRSLEVSDEDYPPASQRAEEQGVVRVSVQIDTNGRVTGCNVTQSSNFPRLDEKTCQIALRRWRGKPALQNGQPVASTAIKAVRWQLK